MIRLQPAESIAIVFATYYHVHMRYLTGNSDRQTSKAIPSLAFHLRHGKNGKPESVGYTFLSFFRDSMANVHKAIAAPPIRRAMGEFELAFYRVVAAAFAYD